MLNISYSVSPLVRLVLDSIDSSRQKTLLTVLPPATIRRLTWDANITRMQSVAAVTGENFTKDQISSLAAGSNQPKSDAGKILVNYHDALAVIFEECTGSSRKINVTWVDSIISRINTAVRTKYPWTHPPQNQIHEILTWISGLNEHPVVTAAILTGSITGLYPQLHLQPVGALLSYAILARSGFDGRGLLTIEDNLSQMAGTTADGLKSVRESGNYTPWIEHFANVINQQYHHLLEKLNSARDTEIPAFFSLSDRQRHILGLVDAPGVQLTNRKITKHFKISQITASRDLAHLTTLGLLMQHGRGRSIYYTKL